MLEIVYCGNSLRDWGISLLIIAGAVVLNKTVGCVFRRITKRTKTQSDDLIYAAVEKPVMLGVMLVALWIAAGRLTLAAELQAIIAKSYRVLIALNVTWFFARFIIVLLEVSILRRKDSQKANLHFSRTFSSLIKRGLLTLIWFTGIVMALNNIGIDVTTLWGTLGIGGIAFALAAQDTIKNIFGGITIFTDRMFRIGDVILFDAIEGTVEDIGLRRTRIRTYDKRLVTVPNARLMDTTITNITSEQARRVVVTLGLTYDTTSDQMQAALELLQLLPDAIPEVSRKDFLAVFSDFSDSALVITLIYFIRKSAPIRETVSKVNFEILRMFNGAGLDFAFPSQTIYLAGNSKKQ
jgi:MscS family membrane protein